MSVVSCNFITCWSINTRKIKAVDILSSFPSCPKLVRREFRKKSTRLQNNANCPSRVVSTCHCLQSSISSLAVTSSVCRRSKLRVFICQRQCNRVSFSLVAICQAHYIVRIHTTIFTRFAWLTLFPFSLCMQTNSILCLSIHSCTTWLFCHSLSIRCIQLVFALISTGFGPFFRTTNACFLHVWDLPYSP
jgi:hypothetical protein